MELPLNRLRMLREVARRGTVTGAAAGLSYTPSAISQQLAALERDTGAALFERVGRGLRLTEVGRVLATHAEDILAAEERAVVAVERAREALVAELRVGVLATVAVALLPPMLARIHADHPGVRVITRETDPEDAVVAVRQGDLDLAFVVDYPDAPMPWESGVDVEPVGDERLHLAAPSRQFPPDTPVGLVELAERSWIISGPDRHYGRAVRAACQREGFEPTVSHQVDEHATAMAMVAAGLGVTLVPDLGLALRPAGVDVVSLSRTVRRRVVLAHRTTTIDRPAVRLFLDTAREAARDLGLSAVDEDGAEVAGA